MFTSDRSWEVGSTLVSQSVCAELHVGFSDRPRERQPTTANRRKAVVSFVVYMCSFYKYHFIRDGYCKLQLEVVPMLAVV
jgi:hypothetical protein